MSKPPSKSGGNGRGRTSGGAFRDGSSFGRSSFGSSSRNSSPRDGGKSDRGTSDRASSDRGGARYNGGSGSRGEASRGRGARDDTRNNYRGEQRSESRGGPRRDDSRNNNPRSNASREGGFRSQRDNSARPNAPFGSAINQSGLRKHERDDTLRSREPRVEQGRSAGTRDEAARSFGANPRGSYSRDSSPRDGAPRSTSGNYNRDGGRDNGRSSGGRGAESRYDRDSSRSSGFRGSSSRDGGSRFDQARGSYSRGPARDGGRDSGRDGGRDFSRADRRGYGSRGFDDPPRGPRSSKPTHEAPRAAAPTPKDPTLPEREGERIAKLLARAGVASRREVERMIIDGRVMLGEDVIQTPSTVLTSLQGITVDGNPVAEAEGTRLFLFHKPAGLLTAERDYSGRPTIYTALRNAMPEGSGRVMPVGRLDLSTEGLLLLTNDGEFKRKLELPATGVPRTYRARTFGDITQSRLEELMEGIEVDGVIYGKIDANMERRTGRNQWIEMTLTEGKNREVRRVLEALDLQVSRLIRTSYGPFQLGDLPKGTVVEVTQRELENFRRILSEMKA